MGKIKELIDTLKNKLSTMFANVSGFVCTDTGC